MPHSLPSRRTDGVATVWRIEGGRLPVQRLNPRPVALTAEQRPSREMRKIRALVARRLDALENRPLGDAPDRDGGDTSFGR